ncbi:non-ribosomal peptide synthetase [Paucibacter sp. Y2R2-4]|uniref:non-ribosomal peptide synthetase n=1 Tax=Paucibacter sp. Y2R2-4 TaxID=2893553 RepID=UPI0021E4EF35|nr:amino acid adenylation domain-containing protein [Paucibacter sp. Y2R2-4]MCV2352100.1 amino acid adenylation domain-containing protein [Paucibacter sp. Y2R2-4]
MGHPQTADLTAGDSLPLSLSQREVWLDQRAWPGSAHLNIGGAGFFRGPLDLGRFQRALQMLVERCDALRLVPQPDGTQILLRHYEPPLTLVELPESTPDPQQSMRAYWQQRIREPIALNDRPPWRFILLKASDNLWGLTIQFHHLVMDGWGSSQVMQLWSDLYQSLAPTVSDLAGETASGTPPPYLDFIQASLNYRESPQFALDADYWLQQVGSPPQALFCARGPGSKHTPLASPEASARPSLPAAHLAHLQLNRRDYAAMSSAAEALGSSPFACFLAALALYFGRVQQRSSLLIGVPSLNRSGRRFMRTPGMFAGILAVRIELQPQARAKDLLHHVGQQMLGALRHPRYPLSDLGQRLHLLREGRDHLVDVLLSFERQDYDLPFGEAQLTESRQLFAGLARYPLAISLCDFGKQLDPEMVLEASANCFEAGEAELLGARIWLLAQALSTQPETRLEDFELLPDEERWALVNGVHKDLAQLEAPQPYIDLFEHQAALWPERCALVWNEGQMSYGELARRVESLAGQLRTLGAARNKVVALALERSPEMVIAVLAIGRAGAAFLPLDPQAPLARLAGILVDSGAVALLLDPKAPQELLRLHSRCLHVSLDAKLQVLGDRGAVDRLHAEAAALWSWAKAGADDLAYVLFTSGTSGRPKGVMIEHGALSRRLAWLSKAWAIQAEDRSAQGTQLSFDPALIELLLPLTQGASIALAPPGRLHPQRLAEFILRHGATFSAFVPSSLPGLLAGWRGRSEEPGAPALKLRVACCGGDVLTPTLADRFMRETGAQLYNVYGPTEATIFASAWACQSLHTGPTLLPALDPGVQVLGAAPAAPAHADLPIGRPIDDTRLYVLGPQLQVLPHGVVGDIFIGGGALARGYLGRPDLDEQAFFPDPFQSALPGLAQPRLYRSGDRGWFDMAGRLHFSGRADRQVKLRGYRIELAEVEAACLALVGVSQAVVQLVRAAGQPPALHAWLGGIALDPAAIQAGLRSQLPDYMRPSRVVCLETLPLSDNGKIDLAALPSAESSRTQHASSGPQAPNSAMEHALFALWQQALTPAAENGLSPPPKMFGVHDNFFDLGGDSLAALSILGSMEERLGRTLPLQLMADHPTIAELAQALSLPAARPEVLRALDGGLGSADTALDEVDPADSQQRPVIYLAASGFGDILRLQNLAAALQGEAKLFMLQAPLEPPPATMKEFASLYADAIEAQAPHSGPTFLAGFSVGGVSALETARELQRRGHPPLGLMLLDTIHPDAVFGGAASWRTLGWLVRKLHMQELSMNGRRLSAMFSDPGLISQVMALRGHQCQAFEGPVLLIKSSGLAGWNRLLFQAWHRMMPRQLSTQTVTGLHGSIFEPGHAQDLADTMRRFMQSLSTQEGA